MVRFWFTEQIREEVVTRWGGVVAIEMAVDDESH